jgi:hypothetical protein
MTRGYDARFERKRSFLFGKHAKFPEGDTVLGKRPAFFPEGDTFLRKISEGDTILRRGWLVPVAIFLGAGASSILNSKNGELWHTRILRKPQTKVVRGTLQAIIHRFVVTGGARCEQNCPSRAGGPAVGDCVRVGLLWYIRTHTPE